METLPSRTRRGWIKLVGGSMAAALSHNASLDAIGAAEDSSWQMGLIADLHYGLAPDALERLETFMQAVDQQQPDCLLQLGDFNFGVDAAECMRAWNAFQGPKHHVLGNHDMDKVTKQEIVETWQMPASYYSFDHKGWHFVVLDRNHLRTEPGKYVDYAKANFYVNGQLRGFADPEQLDWLKTDLQQTSLPTVVFAHQGLGMGPTSDIDSASGQIESVLAEANQNGNKVKACFCGHHHIDRYNVQAGIHYLWINSASYYWVGAPYGRMAAYTEPLFTFLRFGSDHSIEVQARHSDWADPTPKERGYPDWRKLNTHIQGRVF